MSISGGIDRVVGWLKWPIAFISLIFLPGVIYALTFVIGDLTRRPRSILPLLVGAGAFLLVWMAALRPKRSRHYLVTLEHELTHALFAWITLHRVSGLRGALGGGGHVAYEGRGNWLIAIAPFVVPVFALVVLMLTIWIDSPGAISALLGLTLAWNVVANWSSTHRHHGDHREAGSIFSFLFVTCANLLLLGVALAYATHARSITGHLAHVLGPARAFFGWLVKLLNPA